jgi:hypothetical protein
MVGTTFSPYGVIFVVMIDTNPASISYASCIVVETFVHQTCL